MLKINFGRLRLHLKTNSSFDLTMMLPGNSIIKFSGLKKGTPAWQPIVLFNEMGSIINFLYPIKL
jgi:hypothetical protein